LKKFRDCSFFQKRANAEEAKQILGAQKWNKLFESTGTPTSKMGKIFKYEQENKKVDFEDSSFEEIDFEKELNSGVVKKEPLVKSQV
jgi:hypothetical protein